MRVTVPGAGGALRRMRTAPSPAPPTGRCSTFGALPVDEMCSSFVLMTDFASPYRKVPYFGIWAEETADDYGKRDAMAVLADAAGCCFDDDVRQRQELLRASSTSPAKPAGPFTWPASGRPWTSRTRS